MKDNDNKEFGGVFVECLETEFNERLFKVDVTHSGIPKDGVPFQFNWTTKSLDKLQSFLAIIRVTDCCNNFGPPILPTGIRPCTGTSPCTIDEIVQRLDNPLLQELVLKVGNTSEEELENRIKQWEEAQKQNNQTQDNNQ